MYALTTQLLHAFLLSLLSLNYMAGKTIEVCLKTNNSKHCHCHHCYCLCLAVDIDSTVRVAVTG